MTEAVALAGFSSPAKLPESIVREALLVSDMYSLNEMAALSLIKSAQEEKTLYPDMPRGLIAVLFYYDSREHFANAFKTIVQARQGISWTLLEGNEELSVSITRYLKPLLNLNMLDKLLDVLTNMDLAKEIDLLQQNRALGDARHRRMVVDKFKSVRSLFAESIFCWAAQTPLEKEECRRLMAHLSKVKLADTPDGSLSTETVTLVMALLYSIEAGHLLAVEDMTDALSSFPITADNTFVPEIHRELKSGREWECRGLKAIVQLAWAVSLANLRQVTYSIQLTDYDAYIDCDEQMLAEALKGDVFSFIEKSVLCKVNLPLDQFHSQRLHNIFADLIHRMPERVKNMKTKADENAQNILAYLREGLQVPANLDQPFEQLLSCLSALYSSDQCQNLLNEFWCESSSSGSLSSRQVALKNFVQLPRDFLPHSLFIPYVRFLASISNGEQVAQRVYDFLRYGRPGSQESNLSWDHFLGALSKYYQNLRLEQPAMDSIYRSSRGARAITPQELEGLVVVLELMTNVVQYDETARVDLSSRGAHSPIELCSGLLTCCVPLSLKTRLVRVLAAFSVSPAVAVTVWQCLEAVAIVPSVDGAPGYSNQGIKQDIEEVESSSEEFPLSQAMVSLLMTLVNSGIPEQLNSSMRGHGFAPYLRLVEQQIFLPHDSRTYRKPEERWTLAKICCSLFHKLVMQYQPATKSISGNRQPAHSIVLDLVHDSKLLRQLLSVVHDAVSLLEQHTDTAGAHDMQITIKLIFEMFLKVLKMQRLILNSEENGALLLIGLDKLLMSMNPRSGNCDHLVNITKLIGHHAVLPQHAAIACELLTIVGGSASGHSHLMPLLMAPQNATSTRQFMVQLIDHASLDTDHTVAAKAVLNLFKTFLSLPGPNLGHFFLGFLDGTGVRNGELRSDLLEPGVRGFPRTALHAILSVLPSLPANLSELAHSLLHTLASHHSTADATLRFLSSRDFVFCSLGSLPIASEETPDRILATAWILKIAALDLRYHASHQQRSQLSRLITLLVSGSESNPETTSDNMDATLNWLGGNSNGSSSRGVLLSLLEVLELNVDPPQPLQCQYLTRAPDLIKSCEEGSNTEINVERLYQLLNQVIQDNGPAGATIAQRGPLEAEVQLVLDYALARNVASTLLVSRRNLMEAWGQLTEVAVTVTPSDMLEGPLHRAFLHAITLELTRRVLDDMARSDLTSLLVSTLLLLVTTLKTLYSGDKATNYVAALDGEESVPGSLLLILRGLVESVTRFRHSHQSVRANVYAALLHFLVIHSQQQVEHDTPSLVVATGESSIEQYQRESYDVVKEELSSLLSVLCCEATAGHHLCRMLSLTSLSAVAALERRAMLGCGNLLSSNSCASALLDQLSQQGQLRRLLDGIEQDDTQLTTLVSTCGDLRPLYVWEARCALLAQLALTPDGARQLLQAGLMARLCKVQVLGCGLETGGGVTLGAIKSALRVCQAIVSSLGSQDWSAGSQIADFLTCHLPTIGGLLQPPSATVPLETLALAAGVVSSTAAAGQTNASIQLLYQQLTSLLPYLLPPHVSSSSSTPQLQSQDNSLLLRLQTVSSCLTCCSHHLHVSPRLVSFQPITDTRSPKTLTIGTLLQALRLSVKTFKDANSEIIITAAATTTTTLNSKSNNEEQSKQQQQQLQQLSAHIAECAEFILWRHLNTFLQGGGTGSGLSSFSTTQQQQPLLRNTLLSGIMHQSNNTTISNINNNTSINYNTTAAAAMLQTASLSVSLPQTAATITPLQAASLKEQVGEAFSELVADLQSLHQLYGAAASHVSFLPAITTRIRKMLVA